MWVILEGPSWCFAIVGPSDHKKSHKILVTAEIVIGYNSQQLLINIKGSELMQAFTTRIGLLSFGFSLFFGTKLAVAGSGLVVVKDGQGELCEKSGPEYPLLHLSSDQAVNSLNAWLKELPQPKLDINTMQKSTAGDTVFLPGPEIAFSGYIKFCGIEERRRYFLILIEHLKEAQKNERAFVLVLLHSRSDLLLEEVQRALEKADGASLFKNHLEKAKRLIEFQRKTPEPYPTETVVRRIEKKLKPVHVPP
jgi:hypothetical protein